MNHALIVAAAIVGTVGGNVIGWGLYELFERIRKK